VTVVETLSAPQRVYDWGGTPLFSGVGSPLNLVESGFGVDGQKLQPTAAGKSAAGYSSVRWANEATVVIGNSNRTIVNGFLLEDASPSAPGVRFAQNEIEFLIGAAPATVAPFISSQPHSQTIVAGGGVAFSVAAGGTPPLSYQWFVGETNPIAGATSANLTLTSVQPVDAGTYRVSVSNAYGVATSDPAALTVTTNGQVNTTLLLVDGSAASPLRRR